MMYFHKLSCCSHVNRYQIAYKLGQSAICDKCRKTGKVIAVAEFNDEGIIQ